MDFLSRHRAKLAGTGGTGSSGPAMYIGEVRVFAHNTVPTGWLRCDGGVYSTETYPALFAAIGNTWGGDGVSTFMVPDARNAAFVGYGTRPGSPNTDTLGTYRNVVQDAGTNALALAAGNYCIAATAESLGTNSEAILLGIGGLQTAVNSKQPLLGYTPENVANKNAPNGYAGLNEDSRVKIENTNWLTLNQFNDLIDRNPFNYSSQVVSLGSTADHITVSAIHDGETLIYVGFSGGVYYSYSESSPIELLPPGSNAKRIRLFGDKILIACADSSSLVGYTATLVDGEIPTLTAINHSTFTNSNWYDIAAYDGGYVFVGNYVNSNEIIYNSVVSATITFNVWHSVSFKNLVDGIDEYPYFSSIVYSPITNKFAISSIVVSLDTPNEFTGDFFYLSPTAWNSLGSITLCTKSINPASIKLNSEYSTLDITETGIIIYTGASSDINKVGIRLAITTNPAAWNISVPLGNQFNGAVNQLHPQYRGSYGCTYLKEFGTSLIYPNRYTTNPISVSNRDIFLINDTDGVLRSTNTKNNQIFAISYLYFKQDSLFILNCSATVGIKRSTFKNIIPNKIATLNKKSLSTPTFNTSTNPEYTFKLESKIGYSGISLVSNNSTNASTLNNAVIGQSTLTTYGGSFALAKSNASIFQKRIYFELELFSGTLGTKTEIGIMSEYGTNRGRAISEPAELDGYAFGMRLIDGQFFTQKKSVGATIGAHFESSGLTPTIGDTLSFCFDFDSKAMWVRLNNGEWNGDPEKGTGGFTTTFSQTVENLTDYPCIFISSDQASTLKLNIGKPSFTKSIPRGYSDLEISAAYSPLESNQLLPADLFIKEAAEGEVLVFKGGKWINASIHDIEDTNTYRSGIDVNNVFTIIEEKYPSGVLKSRSTLSGGTSPHYTTRTEQYFARDGVTVVKTRVYTLTYSNGHLVSEVLQ